MRHKALALAIALVLLTIAAGGTAAAAQPWTFGGSYQNLAFPYVAALQKAAPAACKGLGVKGLETEAFNDTQEEVKMASRTASRRRTCSTRSASPSSMRTMTAARGRA